MIDSLKFRTENLAMRTIVLHYHLFKNAGTSIDLVLKGNFGAKWVTKEFGGPSNTAQVEDWIQAEPEAIAFSSHTMSGPLPEVSGVRVVPIIALRDPVERIRSAYQFERSQVSDSYGAQLAKRTNLKSYVEERLASPGDWQCRNFHMHKLVGFGFSEGSKLDRAKAAIEQLERIGVVVMVNDFATGMAKLKKRLGSTFPDFTWRETKANTSEKRPPVEMDDDLRRLLSSVNAEDFALLEFAETRLGKSQV
jgi:hypothetical protein